MAALSDDQLQELQGHLQHAVTSCTERCLYQSAKWAAELLNALPTSDLTYGSDTDVDSPMSDTPSKTTPRKPPTQDAAEAALEARELHKYLLAKTYFDCREFDRCATVFLPQLLPKGPLNPASPESAKGATAAKGKARLSTSNPPTLTSRSVSHLSQKALFLSLYAKYMAGEKRRDEDSEMILGPQDGGMTVNKELSGISRMLEEYLAERDSKGIQGQGWLEYLYGIVLAKGKNETLAKEWLIKSVNLYPYNWGAWQELSMLLGTYDEVEMLAEQQRLPQNIMSLIFYIYTSQELYQSTEKVHNTLTQVQSLFPTSSFLRTQRALLFYHTKDFEEAERIFSDLLVSDPHRIDSLDHYSNILYVMSARPKLAFLAQVATQTDKFRPETCCVVGNYYSLKSEHEKAVIYFRRALTLDRNSLSAWTLMGHEYVEMKNTHAAIESYRRAVDVNRKDYRAWYGLGQTYEVLEMHSYALFYFQRAAMLRPFDPKMWQAVASCFGKIGKLENGIRAYKRALVAGAYYDAGGGSSFGGEGQLGGGVLDPEVLYQIALLYERLNDREECAAYMELTIAQEEGPDPDEYDGSQGEQMGVGVTPTTSKARMWLARWEFMRGGYQRSMELANELCQDGVEVEDAKALVRDIRARIESEKDAGTKAQVEAVERRFGRKT
ncbi:Anaphase-promoting complex subunit 8 [Coniosporium apollinis]|uniref:Anaphase-promoting complex subunit 8 n=2 Tax=Coniosporium TaxID=2810619 RepID=A0ABQ9NLA3_9PEZI|nr:Anaphase-promoting complex subunit 8 [Cladosporium sp. JES 115]KAJ9658843.1 Anaphase-promoting complex subunit 8 [Coniosporium apollinis]